MTEMRIAVTAGEYDKGETVFAAPGMPGIACLRAPESEEALSAFIREHECRHAVVGIVSYDGALYRALGPGGVLVRFGIGHDSVDKEEATRAGVLCATTPVGLEIPVAEHALALILGAVRRIPAMDRRLRTGEWTPMQGFCLRGRTLAVIGWGAIGREVGRIARDGFGMQVVAFDPFCACDGESVIAAGSADEAIVRADVVTLHIPATPGNIRFVDADRLARFRPGAWLVNTSRGPIVAEDALFDCISSGHLGGAALDVFAEEPYAPANPEKDLRRLENVVMTAHCASNTVESCEAMARRALRNIAQAEAREYDGMDLLNPAAVNRLSA